ncbi:Uma2 family endonuclease [Leptolyngbya sp. KIOST-1]|uniref:Uma2 family endonuclease n=1 Tax=Leptolyngbya sp. KIOST-1 TaxID=1229172 RepID=UPI00055C27CA|nr:Uma2 family endonuclease [Leptolyngbya sp. KIOST-1]
MYAVISRDTIQLPPGTVVRMPGTWQDYQTLCHSRGNSSIPRVKYRSGEILLMSPMPRHGREASLLADIVKALLDSVGRNYEAFTPITMELPETSGIEPDYCFYIDNWAAAVGKDRIRWDAEPPPDLVIEIDITSYTAVEDYAAYQVPEVWLYQRGQLQLFALTAGGYQGAAEIARITGCSLGNAREFMAKLWLTDKS